jgi:hypothetical protein
MPSADCVPFLALGKPRGGCSESLAAFAARPARLGRSGGEAKGGCTPPRRLGLAESQLYLLMMRVGAEVDVARPAPFQAETRTRMRCPTSFLVSL